MKQKGTPLLFVARRGNGEVSAVAVQRTIYFSGQVQGVGFRYTAYRLAADFNVVGFVKNLADGRVQVVAEGEPEEIDRLVEAIRSRMRGYIRDVQSSESPATGRFSRFDVAF